MTTKLVKDRAEYSDTALEADHSHGDTDEDCGEILGEDEGMGGSESHAGHVGGRDPVEDHDQAAQGEVRDVVRLIVNQCLQGILDNDKALLTLVQRAISPHYGRDEGEGFEIQC